jgi:hypothetical protein
LQHKTTYQVPAGYFERFPEEALGMAKARTNEKHTEAESVEEELKRLSPFLSSLPRKYPGTVPAGYFKGLDTLPAGVGLPMHGEAVVIPMQAKVSDTVSMETRKRRSVHPFLAAAVTIGVVLLSAIWGYHTALQPTAFVRSGINLKTPAQLNAALAEVSDQAILEYLKSSTEVNEADLVASEGDDQPITKPDGTPDANNVPEAQPKQE